MENNNFSKKQIPSYLKKDIISELKCKICNGIIRDCYGIPECFHMFCENCLKEYLYKNKENKNIKCPNCNKDWGNYKLCNSMKLKICYIDEIIKIIFPQLEEENKKSKKQLFNEIKKANEENDLNIKKEKELNNNKIQIILKPLINVDDAREKLPQISKNVIQVKMNVSFSEIKKNIIKKLGMNQLNIDDIILRKQGLPIDDSFIDLQSFCDFDTSFYDSNERIIFYSRKIDE